MQGLESAGPVTLDGERKRPEICNGGPEVSRIPCEGVTESLVSDVPYERDRDCENGVHKVDHGGFRNEEQWRKMRNAV